MSRPNFRGCLAALSLAFGVALVCTGPASRTRHKEAKPAAKTEQSGAASADTKKAGKPAQLASYGDWGVFLAQGEKSKTCYALATPKERISRRVETRPRLCLHLQPATAKKVREEISVIMGFPVKEGSAARAEIGESGFDLVAKGTNAWIKNQAEEPKFIDALKKGSKLIVKAPSLKGHVTIDSYSLGGLSQALERVEKECP